MKLDFKFVYYSVDKLMILVYTDANIISFQWIFYFGNQRRRWLHHLSENGFVPIQKIKLYRQIQV